MNFSDVILLSQTRNGLHPLTANAVDEAKKAGMTWMHQWGNSDLPHARSKLLNLALNHTPRPKAVMWVDHDIVFKVQNIKDILNSLGKNKNGCVCGFYMCRNSSRPSFRNFKEIKVELESKNHLLDVAGAPLGFTAILVDALDDAKKFVQEFYENDKLHKMWCLPFIKNNIYYSEDYALSWRLRAAGWKVKVDLSVCVKHVYDHPFDYNDIIALNNVSEIKILHVMPNSKTIEELLLKDTL